jgi:methylenetetrahydrofolate--tRNA-(uracil-5-)-methyltransferase
MIEPLIVVGGGLAGTEAAWQAAQRGVPVILNEMRPVRKTPAHVTDQLAELVCSNSLGSTLVDRAPGLLKEELRRMGAMLMTAATQAAVPAGSALAVDREVFARIVTEKIETHPLITVERSEVRHIPGGPAIIATGPLTSATLATEIGRLSGERYLYFFDAIAPIVDVDSINLDIAFRASRYGRGEQDEGDYINCPFSEEEYEAFIDALLAAEQIELKPFERREMEEKFFEMCLPVEVMARRGRQALAFGPMRPVGLIDPRTGERPYAVVQLRQDNLAGTLYNMVGFQTNLRWGEQRRVLRLVPGLDRAEFARYGMMHRNTFINAPTLLRSTLQWRDRDDLFFAGQITGVEGYVGNVGTGLLAGINAVRLIYGQLPLVLPQTTMLGALCYYVTHADAADFQPMKANFGLLPPLAGRIRNKRQRYAAYARRALADLELALDAADVEPVPDTARLSV